jgi:ribosomal protein S12 methylthiotransferase accessory factor
LNSDSIALSPLQSRIKNNTSSIETSLTRVMSTHETLSKILPISKKIGITRVSDVTFMDKLYIPNFSAILPGTEDTIWVYGGKGPTKLEAKVSALMEAIERYSSLTNSYSRSIIQGSYNELSKSYSKVIHPNEVVESINPDYDDEDAIMDFLLGFDLLNNEEVLVPAEIALYKYSPKFPSICAFSDSHTNGLASGNVLEESISHSLCEIIERDALSIADLSTSSIPYNILENITYSLEKQQNYQFSISQDLANKFVDDSSIFPDVDISEITKEIDIINGIIKRFSNAGISLLIKDITQKDIGIPTFVASSVEWVTSDYGYFAKGSGTHPDARIALLRAITELSQTRAINIQGARDDLKRIKYKENDDIIKRKWQFMPNSSLSSLTQLYKNTIKFSEINTYSNNDILDDIHVILCGLKKAGLKRAVVVDLTNPDIGIPVVRAIVPGLETFEVTKSIMGKRAKRYFKKLFTKNL